MKFSIVTPVYNGEKYIAETIESVLSQGGNFEIEYIIQDGGSSDSTIEIIKNYEKKLTDGEYPTKCNKVTLKWRSEKDGGMYDAIEKGFSEAQGDIFAYINADDKYLPGAFAAVAKIFETFPGVEWLKGINTTSDENGRETSAGSCYVYKQKWIAKGIYGRNAYFIQQDSVFWKRTLWEKARANISIYKLAGDYALWIKFAQMAPLWSFNLRISSFRKHLNQLSANMHAYKAEQDLIAPYNFFLGKRVSLFFTIVYFLKIKPKSMTSKLLYKLFFPLDNKECYIDFDSEGIAVKRPATSYII